MAYKRELKIDNYKYFENNEIVEAILPEEVTKIGERAFSNCKNLKKVVMSENVNYIGQAAFSGCENLQEITLSKNITKIHYRTFANCRRLKKIVIPEGVKEIDWAAFAECNNLEEISLPSTLVKIDKQIFFNCKKLKYINLPDNFTSLPDELFRGCSSLNIKLSKNIKKLGNSVFRDCYNQSIFPYDVISFGDDCFKNCWKLNNITLNKEITNLSDGMFEGCKELTSITYLGKEKIKIGKRTFRNCYKLPLIPEFIQSYNDKAFENCWSLTEVEIIDSIIPFACFRGCKNIRNIKNQDKIYYLKDFAFSGCESLKDVDISHVSKISAEAFSNCKGLLNVKLSSFTLSIGSRAFYNCVNLQSINMPDTVSEVKKEAFKYCHSIKVLIIPANLKSFGSAAFSYMNSLDRIEVSQYNDTFITPDNKILINKNLESLVLYASGLKDEIYSLKEYNFELDIFDRILVKPIKGIGPYAFAGAKNLKELNVCNCTTDVEYTAFCGCPNLKKLNFISIAFFTTAGFNIRDNGKYYFRENNSERPQIPFKIVEFSNGSDEDTLIWIYQNALKYFDNVEQIILPREGSYFIGANAFEDCRKVKEVFIPENVSNICDYAFSKETTLKFYNDLALNNLVKLEINSNYSRTYKLYTFDNDTFLIEENGIIKSLSKKEIDSLCTHSELIRNNPVLFVDFMNDLYRNNLDVEFLFNGLLFANMSLENRKIMIDYLKKEDLFAINVLIKSNIFSILNKETEKLLNEKNFRIVIEFIELLRKYNITNPIFYNTMLMANYDFESLERLINLDYDFLIKIINLGKIFEPDSYSLPVQNESEDVYLLTYHALNANNLEKFIRLIKKYNIQDRYFYNKAFISISSNPLLEELFKIYDINTKRLLKTSLALNLNVVAIDNLNDLLVLMKITGALNEDPIKRQRACTFIIEKMFDEILPNGEINECRIVGNDIHRIFNFSTLCDYFDEEFATFFLENYIELITEEKSKSGFIQRVYLNFREISRTSTSDKGSQRHLKVTMTKCKNYLSNVKFDGVRKEELKFAELIGAWYDKNECWINAKKIYQESLSAPRNIFTEVNYDNNGNVIYDYNPEHDLKEIISSDFSYEWLPKQDYNNLLLGKYCSCCAHLDGAGQGIMRASMILDCCQNLVIRNGFGLIIAKATLYVNKKEGYAVFNNVETSLNFRNSYELSNIYNAFLRGINAFIEIYNKNNPKYPINNVSIGSNRNTILSYLTDDKHPSVPINKALEYGEYSIGDYKYNGDWSSSQRLVLRKPGV